MCDERDLGRLQRAAERVGRLGSVRDEDPAVLARDRERQGMPLPGPRIVEDDRDAHRRARGEPSGQGRDPVGRHGLDPLRLGDERRQRRPQVAGRQRARFAPWLGADRPDLAQRVEVERKLQAVAARRTGRGRSTGATAAAELGSGNGCVARGRGVRARPGRAPAQPGAAGRLGLR